MQLYYMLYCSATGQNIEHANLTSQQPFLVRPLGCADMFRIQPFMIERHQLERAHLSYCLYTISYMAVSPSIPLKGTEHDDYNVQDQVTLCANSV